MKNVPVIDELRAIRQRLAHQQEYDVRKYAAMLREVARQTPGEYVTQPVLPLAAQPLAADVGDAG
jgi:hypothetical protein